MEGMSREEGSCKEIKEGEDKEIYAKSSVTPVTKRDTSVAIAPSIHGIGKIVTGKTGSHIKVKDTKQ